MSDQSRPNHYFNDSLGDPAACTGNHNHPGVDPDTVACTRCKTLLKDSPSVDGSMLVQTYTPGIGSKRRAVLCGACSLLLLELLLPELAEDANYQAHKALLESLWQ